MAKKRRTRKQSRAGAAVDAFDAYYHDDSLESWQRMMADLDIDGHFPSKTQCRKALRGVHVNIYDFMDAVADGSSVPRHPSQQALAKYTWSSRKTYPLDCLRAGSPLAALLSQVRMNKGSR